MEISPLQLRALMADAAELGAQKVMIKAGKLKSRISKTDAFRIYGKRTVLRWISEGNLTLHKISPNANKLWIHTDEIEALNKAYAPLYEHE